MMMRKERGKAVGSIVVAVDGEHKTSQYALKWAVDRLLHRDTSPHRSIVLLNVRHSSPIMPTFNNSHSPVSAYCTYSNSILEREPDDQEMEVLRPFRGFCTRRQIGFEIVVVEDEDVAQALVDYSIRHRVENLLMGAPSRNKGLSKLFKNGSGIASTVVKWVPNFCSVYMISKLGKVKNVRKADHSIPPLHHNTNHVLAVSTRGRGGSTPDRFANNEFVSEFGVFPSSGASSPCNDAALLCPSPDLDSHQGFHFLNECTAAEAAEATEAASLLLTRKLESMEEKMRRLKLDQNQTDGVAGKKAHEREREKREESVSHNGEEKTDMYKSKAKHGREDE